MDIQKALDMRAEGVPWYDIAEALGVPLYTVRYNCDLAGVERRHYRSVSADQIKALRLTGATWSQLECATGYTRSGLQRILRES